MKKQLFVLILLLNVLCLTANAQAKRESLKILWPGEYQWKIASNQQNAVTQIIELLPAGQTLNNWTIIGTMQSIKGMQHTSMPAAIKMTLDKLKGNIPKAKVVVIERNEKVKNPWIIFKIESPYATNNKVPQSQLYYIIQGDQSLYTNFVAVKEKTINSLFAEKWVKVFKSSTLVH